MFRDTSNLFSFWLCIFNSAYFIITPNVITFTQFLKILDMRGIFIIIIITFSFCSSFSQPIIPVRNFNFKPVMDENSGGIWEPFKTSWYNEKDSSTYKNIARSVDSFFVNKAGWPDYGDLMVPDFEVKVKALWFGDSIFFLLQRLDDNYVTGYNNNGSVDETVAEGLINRDATTLYFYFSNDSARLDTTYNFSDSVAWLRFGWQSDDVEAKLLTGDMVNSFDDFHAEAIQWCEEPYCYTKIGISLDEHAPYIKDSIEANIAKYGIGYFGFAIDATENDKEIGEAPFGIQTRAHWYKDMGESALDFVSDWGWLWFVHDTLAYHSPVHNSVINFASVYPNPANDFLNVTLLEGFESDYRLVDIMGRVVLSGYFYEQENRLDTQNLLPGAYYLVLNDRRGNLLTRKVLIIN